MSTMAQSMKKNASVTIAPELYEQARLVKKTLSVRLNPQLSINGQVFILMTHQMACVPHSLLGKKIVDLSCQRDTIKHAIDLLINGF
ncbi:CcdB family protein [Providencia rettgeri]|nr:CcdB family protein [Providencia rettgeri]